MSDGMMKVDESKTLQESLFGFPETIPQAARMYKECGKWKKILDDREKKLRQYLRDQMPIDEEGMVFESAKEGVHRKVWYQKSTAYGKALAEIKELLIPKTRWDEVDKILADHTSTSLRDSFEEEQDDAI